VRWGTLDLSGRGGFYLDDQLRPQRSIDAFHAAGLLDDDERSSIDSMLSFLGQRGALTDIGLPLQAGKGLIFVGLVSLGKIDWVIPLNQSAD